jgi:uncharacterized protein YjbI with pentapeptide repeats
VARLNWVAGLPGDNAAVDAFPSCDDELLELGDVRVVGASTATVVDLERPEVVDVALVRCDVVGFTGTRGRAARVLIEQSRLRAVTWVDGMVEDVVLDGVTGVDVSFRFSTLRRVVLRDCVLPGLDFTETVFDDVRLERCDLAGARFERAKVTRLRIEGCDLTGCSGTGYLAGASVHPDDLITLGPSLAEALAITVE